MTFVEQLRMIQRLDALIRRKSTGSPKQLAGRLNVSRASLYRYLNELRNLGAHVEYCSNRGSYFYNEPFELDF